MHKNFQQTTFQAVMQHISITIDSYISMSISFFDFKIVKKDKLE